MATRYFCDRCAAAFHDRTALMPVTLPHPMDSVRIIELCPRCLLHLRREAEPLAQEAPARG